MQIGFFAPSHLTSPVSSTGDLAFQPNGIANSLLILHQTSAPPAAGLTIQSISQAVAVGNAGLGGPGGIELLAATGNDLFLAPGGLPLFPILKLTQFDAAHIGQLQVVGGFAGVDGALGLLNIGHGGVTGGDFVFNTAGGGNYYFGQAGNNTVFTIAYTGNIANGLTLSPGGATVKLTATGSSGTINFNLQSTGASSTVQLNGAVVVTPSGHMALYGGTPVAQPVAIVAPAGGATVDTQARAAIVSILNAIGAAAGGIGITA